MGTAEPILKFRFHSLGGHSTFDNHACAASLLLGRCHWLFHRVTCERCPRWSHLNEGDEERNTERGSAGTAGIKMDGSRRSSISEFPVISQVEQPPETNVQDY